MNPEQIGLRQTRELLAWAGMEKWAEALPAQIEELISRRLHGDWPKWREALAGLPDISCHAVDLNAPAVTLRDAMPIGVDTEETMASAMLELHPWRKGPFDLAGLRIDAEWRSDWKWQRMEGRIAPLAGRKILDVGCGNGYYAWRMLGQGADLVIGVDPTQLFLAQFLAVRKYLAAVDSALIDRFRFLPLGVEAIPEGLRAFDTTFSMGVLYHRRSPFEHLVSLRETLRSGGELVLETLVISGEEDRVLVPSGRYAKMRNVWFLPSVAAMLNWLGRAGFRNARMVDLTRTSREEQRRTRWMRFESLEDFLDPGDPGKTIEGHPAPTRAVFLAEAP